MQQNRPSEGPFGAVYGQLHAGLVIRTLLSASVLPDTTGRLVCELAQWVSSMDLSTRRFNSRSRSTEQHNSTSTSKALQIVPPTASGRSKNIESSMPQLKGSITAPTAVIPVHRTRSRGHFLTSADAVARRSPGARRRPAQNGRKGIGTILSYFVHAIDPIMGPGSQKLDRIGANGYMVVRLRVSCWHDAGSCRLQRFARKLLRKSDNS